MHDLNLAANTARSDDVVTPAMLWAAYRVEAQFLTCHAAINVIVPTLRTKVV